jgi:hypothetical protein
MLPLLYAHTLSGKVTSHEFVIGSRKIQLLIDEKRLALSLIVFVTSLSWKAVFVLNTSLLLDDMTRNTNPVWLTVDSMELSAVLSLSVLFGGFLFVRMSFLYVFLFHLLSFLVLNHREDIIGSAIRLGALLTERVVTLRDWVLDYKTE